MPCYYPVTLFKSRQGRDKKTGRWPLVGLADGYRDLPVQVPCSRCIGCRLERSRQWAIRCVCESQMHDQNCFLTLTYRDEELLHGYLRPTLFPRHLELFWKRLRKEYGDGIRYFACGEYGERFGRPHYHACVFGFDFPDKTFHSSKNGIDLYHSNSLDLLWSHGNCLIGSVTFESAAYVARYIMDKKLGQAASFYTEQGIEPEFVRMSRGGRKRKDGSQSFGIAHEWYERYKSDVFPHDYCVIRDGVKTRPPKYFSLKYALDNPSEFATIELNRKLASYKSLGEMTRERLIVREKVKIAQISSLSR